MLGKRADREMICFKVILNNESELPIVKLSVFLTVCFEEIETL